jgi:hypothetical protein
MKKKETAFPFARPFEQTAEHRALVNKERGAGAYPSFAEVCKSGDFRDLVQRAARRVLGPAAIAGVIVAAGGCDAASEFYSDLLAPPPDPIVIAPIEMSEIPELPHATPIQTPTPPIEPCPIPEEVASSGPKPPPQPPVVRPPMVRGRMPVVRPIAPVTPPYALSGDVAAVDP